MAATGAPPDPAIPTLAVPAPRATTEPSPVALLAAEFRDLTVAKSGHGVHTLIGTDRDSGARVLNS